MSQRKIVVAASVVLAIAAIGLVQTPAGAVDLADWTLTGCEGGKATSGAKCNLKNQKSQRCLVFDSNVGQTDWNLGACGGNQVTLVNKGGGPIKCGEPVALKIGNEFFRKCVSPQTVGINICSEVSPSPQDRIGGTNATHWDWKIAGCPDGQPVEMDKTIVLRNISRNDSVVFAKRPSKVADTCWASSMKLGQCISARDK